MSASTNARSRARWTELEGVAVAAGTAWADWWSDTLRSQERPMSGGWPGTLSEARARVTARLRLQPNAGPLAILELDRLAKTTYETARAAWLARSTRDSER